MLSIFGWIIGCVIAAFFVAAGGFAVGVCYERALLPGAEASAREGGRAEASAEIERLAAAVERERARAQERCDAQARCAYQYQEKMAQLRARHATEIAGRDRLDEAIRRRWRRVDERALAVNPAWRSSPEVAAAVEGLLVALDGDAIVDATPVPERASAPAQSGTRAKAGKREATNG